MNGVLDNFLVGVVLFAGFGYAIYSLGPKSLRARLLTVTASVFARFPFAGLRGIAERMAAAAGKAKGSCGGCDTCGSNERAAKGSGGAPEIKIPLSKIGKRRSARDR